MKHIYIALVLLIGLLTFSSCKKDDDTPINDPTAENRKALGVSAEDLLSDDVYTSLTVEFVYPGSFRPTDIAINNFINFLTERLNKPNGITIVETVISAPSGAPFSVAEIRDIEDEFRTEYNTANKMAVYVFFSNGSSANDTDTTVTLGTAYLNTSIVVYEKTLKDLANQNSNLDLSTLETSTLTHEFGHILGLVNIQNDDIHTNHEDPAHLKHCQVDTCLMYFESNSAHKIIEYFSRGNQIPVLDPLCIADLQSKGGL